MFCLYFVSTINREKERETISHLSLNLIIHPWFQGSRRSGSEHHPWKRCAWQQCFMFIVLRSEFDIAGPPYFITTVL